MIQIQEPNSPWEIVHMDWVTVLAPGGDRSFNTCPVLVERYSKTPIFLPFNKYNTAMDTAIMIWNRFIIHTGLFQSIISDRHPNSLQPYEKISITCLEQSYNSQKSITLKLMDYYRELYKL
ncbi:hypothetical protein O181_057383 [Austropuccinia psidii MF-1]|uniref:Integrase catalytic domain-containing protein n=1 Tax=Austropuccinia psidii MF-1 TaxID=1389203 RepID=A0A9Q3EB81_9BASI|nr:hypothetical protein [Austropuccinia psidii MF-1]